MIRPNDEQYWLYAAVDLETNELLHTTLEPTEINVIAHTFFVERREKHDVDDGPRTACSFRGLTRRARLVNTVFLIDGTTPLTNACNRHGLDFRYERHENRNSVKRVFREIK